MTTAEMLIEEGKIKGWIEGWIEGKIEEKVAIALEMIRYSLDVNSIVRCTGLTAKQVEMLKRDGMLA